MLRRADAELDELLVRTYQNVNRVESSMLASSQNDLSIAELHILESVGRGEGGSRSISAIAQAMEITLPTVTVAVKRLEKKGYVQKSKDENDGRVTRVALTAQGRKMDAAHRYFHENMVRSITREMSEAEVEALVRILSKLNRFLLRKQGEMSEKRQGEQEI